MKPPTGEIRYFQEPKPPPKSGVGEMKKPPGFSEQPLIRGLDAVLAAKKPTVHADLTVAALAKKEEPKLPQTLPPDVQIRQVATEIGRLSDIAALSTTPEAERAEINRKLADLQDQLAQLGRKVAGVKKDESVAGKTQDRQEESTTEGRGEVAENKEDIQVKMRQAEEDYVIKNGEKNEGLRQRYEHESVSASSYKADVEGYVTGMGLSHEQASELEGKVYDGSSEKVIAQRIQRQIDILFNSDQGRKNPEKHQIVTDQTQRYLELVTQARVEGDLPKDMQAQDVMRLVEDNVWSLAYQDRVASENTLGDHGVRHLAGHNIRVFETQLMLVDIISTLNQAGVVLPENRLVQLQLAFIEKAQQPKSLSRTTDTLSNATRGGESRGWDKHIPRFGDYLHAWTDVRQNFPEIPEKLQMGKAIDKLIGHEVNIRHDGGYANRYVRSEINKGNFFAGGGHNVLAAKANIREDDQLPSIYTKQQIAQLHRGVLEHDDGTINFNVREYSADARDQNIQSAIHGADISHAFADKLPELLYSHPESLKYMRLMKTAVETGDGQVFTQLQGQLRESIRQNQNYSSDDREALLTTVDSIHQEFFKIGTGMIVGRICGVRPQFTMNQDGVFHVINQESANHRAVMRQWGQPELDRMHKVVAELAGKSKGEVDLNAGWIESVNGRVVIEVQTGQQRATAAESKFDSQIDELVEEPEFQDFVITDTPLMTDQVNLEIKLKNYNPSDTMYGTISDGIVQIKQQRRDNLQKYLQKGTAA